MAAGAAASPSPAAAAAETAAAAAASEKAVDSIGHLSDVQPLLKELYGKVDGKADRAMLGDALRKLQDLAAALEGKADAGAVHDLQARIAALPAGAPAAAAAAAGAASGDGKQQQEQQWVVSHEVKAGDGDSDLAAGLEELRGRVAALAAQVAALKGSRPPSAAEEKAAAANGHVVPPLPAQLRSSSVSEGHDLASVQVGGSGRYQLRSGYVVGRAGHVACGQLAAKSRVGSLGLGCDRAQTCVPSVLNTHSSASSSSLNPFPHRRRCPRCTGSWVSCRRGWRARRTGATWRRWSWRSTPRPTWTSWRS